MNSIQVFKTPDSKTIRTTSVNGNPWFVAKDVCESIGVDTSNVGNKIGGVPDEWKGRYPLATPGGVQNLLCLAEPGLYFFLARSDKPGALPFQKWIAGEVVPSIRKTGSYSIKEAKQRHISASLVAEIRKVYGEEKAQPRIDHIIGYTAEQKQKAGHPGHYDPEIIKAYNNAKVFLRSIENGERFESVSVAIENAGEPFLSLCARLSKMRAGIKSKENEIAYNPTTEAQA